MFTPPQLRRAPIAHIEHARPFRASLAYVQSIIATIILQGAEG
jgi:hypothetical protein